MGRTRLAITRFLSALMLVASVLIISGNPATASTCAVRLFGGYYVCGDVVNHSAGLVMIGGGGPPTDPDNLYNGWCTANTRAIYTTDDAIPPPCTSSNFARVYLYQNEVSGEWIKDADSFEVPAGCKFNWTATLGGSQTIVTDRRGKSKDEWIKLGDTTTITVNSQTCSGTPAHYTVSTFATTTGYQEPYCYQEHTSSLNDWCGPDGSLYANTNYVFCKMLGSRVGNSSVYNDYWLLTDLDTVNSGRDGRAYVSAYYLSGSANSANNSAYDVNGHAIPNC